MIAQIEDVAGDHPLSLAPFSMSSGSVIATAIIRDRSAPLDGASDPLMVYGVEYAIECLERLREDGRRAANVFRRSDALHKAHVSGAKPYVALATVADADWKKSRTGQFVEYCGSRSLVVAAFPGVADEGTSRSELAGFAPA